MRKPSLLIPVARVQNFSLFSYVNELNTDIERLEEQIAEIKSEIEKYKGQGVNTENQRKKILKDLEDKLSKTEAKSQQYDEKYQAAQKTVNALKIGITSIFPPAWWRGTGVCLSSPVKLSRLLLM